MKIWRSLDDVPDEPGRTALSLGCFDGVHRGHQLLLGRLRQVAGAIEARSVVVTFDSLPAQLLYPETAPSAIMALDDRLDAFRTAGADAVLVLKYTSDLAAQSAESFVEHVFVKALHAGAVVVGEDCRFGRGRAGNVEMLRNTGLRWGFGVTVMEDRTAGGVGGRRYSSTWVREALTSGDLATAEEILGRPHRIRMHVTQTSGSGAANGSSVQGMLPPPGEYVGWIQMGLNEGTPGTLHIVKTSSRDEGTHVELEMPGFFADKMHERAREIAFDFSQPFMGATPREQGE